MRGIFQILPWRGPILRFLALLDYLSRANDVALGFVILFSPFETVEQINAKIWASGLSR